MPSVTFIEYKKRSGSNANPDVQLSIRQFVLPELNHKTKSYHELAVSLNAKDNEDPPPTPPQLEVSMLKKHSLQLFFLVFIILATISQLRKRRAKLVTKASITVIGFE